jgi:hypothetical protein
MTGALFFLAAGLLVIGAALYVRDLSTSPWLLTLIGLILLARAASLFFRARTVATAPSLGYSHPTPNDSGEEENRKCLRLVK